MHVDFAQDPTGLCRVDVCGLLLFVEIVGIV